MGSLKIRVRTLKPVSSPIIRKGNQLVGRLVWTNYLMFPSVFASWVFINVIPKAKCIVDIDPLGHIAICRIVSGFPIGARKKCKPKMRNSLVATWRCPGLPYRGAVPAIGPVYHGKTVEIRGIR
ncbi:hypothetical protein GCM10025785_11190 [Corynebacterium canis]